MTTPDSAPSFDSTVCAAMIAEHYHTRRDTILMLDSQQGMYFDTALSAWLEAAYAADPESFDNASTAATGAFGAIAFFYEQLRLFVHERFPTESIEDRQYREAIRAEDERLKGVLREIAARSTNVDDLRWQIGSDPAFTGGIAINVGKPGRLPYSVVTPWGSVSITTTRTDIGRSISVS